jgi:hypothetical protein
MIQSGGMIWMGIETGEIMVVRSESFSKVGCWFAHSSTVTALCMVDDCVWSGCDSGEIIIWKLAVSSHSRIPFLRSFYFF